MQRRNLLLGLAFAAVTTVFTGNLFAEDSAGQKEEAVGKRVIVCYFHRTQRCPTCQIMGGLVEQTVKQRFADEVKAGKVAAMEIDFQKPENKKYADAYKVTGPKLVIVQADGGSVKQWKSADKLMRLVAESQDKASAYVQEEIKAYLN